MHYRIGNAVSTIKNENGYKEPFYYDSENNIRQIVNDTSKTSHSDYFLTMGRLYVCINKASRLVVYNISTFLISGHAVDGDARAYSLSYCGETLSCSSPVRLVPIQANSCRRRNECQRLCK